MAPLQPIWASPVAQRPLGIVARGPTAFDEFLEDLGPCRCMQRQAALAHVACVVAVLYADQIGIGTREDAELANGCGALPFPDADGIRVGDLPASSGERHKEWSVDATGAEAANDLE